MAVMVPRGGSGRVSALSRFFSFCFRPLLSVPKRCQWQNKAELETHTHQALEAKNA